MSVSATLLLHDRSLTAYGAAKVCEILKYGGNEYRRGLSA